MPLFAHEHLRESMIWNPSALQDRSNDLTALLVSRALRRLSAPTSVNELLDRFREVMLSFLQMASLSYAIERISIDSAVK